MENFGMPNLGGSVEQTPKKVEETPNKKDSFFDKFKKGVKKAVLPTVVGIAAAMPMKAAAETPVQAEKGKDASALVEKGRVNMDAQMAAANGEMSLEELMALNKAENEKNRAHNAKVRGEKPGDDSKRMASGY